MTQERPDHRMALAERKRPRSVDVARVVDPELVRRAVHVVLLECHNLDPATAGEQQQPDRRDRRREHRAVGLGRVERAAASCPTPPQAGTS